MKSKITWALWAVLSLVAAGLLGNEMFFEREKPHFIVGEASHGHYQIEMACDACHTEAFGGTELIHDACVGCHQEELNEVNDSHPIKKFTNPRNADRVKILDARNCVTCHKEHQLEQTGDYGVTLPEDYCFRCHEDIAEERPSHEGMGFETCASAGCHNYHDNLSLYEDFLTKHANAPMIKTLATVLEPNHQETLERKPAVTQADAPATYANDEVEAHWLASSHAQAGISCSGCHEQSGEWQQDPGVEACASCHTKESEGFLKGKHGMRLDQGLSPMHPGMARLDFKDDADQSGLDCASCHDPHQPNLKEAAVEACVSCHNDEHSQNYFDSPHFALWQKELNGEAEENTGVACATCHMPAVANKFNPNKVHIEHNQSLYLRPNEKMIRPVCLSCHSLEFSIDALADEALIKNNFNGQPSVHVRSIEMALDRLK